MADQFPPGDEVCKMEDNMDYHRVKIGNGDFLLPEAAAMDVLFSEGIESVNEIAYSNCREYAAKRPSASMMTPLPPRRRRSKPRNPPLGGSSYRQVFAFVSA